MASVTIKNHSYLSLTPFHSMRHDALQTGKSWISLILVLALGVGIGLGLFHLSSRQPELGRDTAPQIPEPPAEAVSPHAVPNSPVVEVRLLNSENASVARAAGVLVTPERWLILPVAAMDEVRVAGLPLGGALAPLGPVLAVDPGTGLAALGTGFAGGPTLSPVADGGSLFLGREVRALGAGERADGWVDSPAQKRATGDYIYEVRLDKPLRSSFAALVPIGSEQLIGLIIERATKPGVYVAVDVGAVNQLLAKVGQTTPTTVAEFSTQYFGETAEGMLHRLARAAAEGAWSEVVELGRALFRLDARLAGRAASELDRGYLELAVRAQESHRASEALALLDEADQVLGLGTERILLRARILSDSGQTLAAVQTLNAATDQGVSDELISVLRQSLVLEAVRDGTQSSETQIRLVEEALARDPDFGIYHAELGRLLFQQGRYAEALASFNRAVQLDATLGRDLEGVIRKAQQRALTPARTVVPVVTTGNIMYVQVHINRDPQSFRFILDTGASFTAISAQTARAIGAAGLTSARRVTLNTANGAVTAPLITLRSIDLGGATVENVEVVVLDAMGPYDGLLGLSFLSHFNIDLDQNAGEIALTRR